MGSEARARVALAAVIAVATLAFAQVFAAAQWVGPTLLAALLATTLAAAARRLGIGPALTLAVETVALLVYLVVVFKARRSFYGLPTTDALASIWRSLVRSYEHSRVDYAPVPLRTGYVMLAVIGAWIAAAWAEVATFRWRQPLLATLPATALVCLMLIVGTGAGATILVLGYLGSLFTFWALESSDRLGSWGRAVTRPGRSSPAATGTFGRIARRMVMSCLGSALVVPLLLPSLGSGALPWRTGIGEGGGPSLGGGVASGAIDPFVRIAPSLISQSGDTLFSVTADDSSYWRLLSLTAFDGERWFAPSEPRIFAAGGAITTTQGGNETVLRSVTQGYNIGGLRGAYLPAASTPYTVGMPGNLVDRLRVQKDTGDLALDGGIDGPLSYTVTSFVPKLGFQELKDAVPGAPGPEYLDHPELDREVMALITGWTAAAPSPGEKLIALQEHLRAFEYRLPTEDDVAAATQGDGASARYLTRFLTEIRAGYCQQFSTAFALAARALGYPSRVSVGFLPGQAELAAAADAVGATTTSYTVRGTDAHAWPEIYFEEYGWVPFEPTPRSEAAVPRYTLSPVAAAANFQRPDAEIFDPRGGQSGINIRTLTDPGVAGVEGIEPAAEAGVRGRRATGAWARSFDRLLRFAAAGSMALAVAVPLYVLGRGRRRYARARDARALAAAAFIHFQEGAASLGAARGGAESAREFTTRVAAQKRLPRNTALRLATLSDAADYSNSFSSVQASEARRLAGALRRGLWSGATWWERLVGTFSPTRNGISVRVRRKP